MSTGETWTLGHRPALDGLRGVAVLLVLASHGLWWLPAMEQLGFVGVTVFFTLSGFLITTLLMDERAKHGRVRFGRFYLRRARRLMPALIACTLTTGLVLLAIGRDVRAVGEDVAVVLTYLSNVSYVAGNNLGPFLHTWSLSLEEQFYLVWPILLLVALRFGGRRLVLWSCAAAVGAIQMWRLELWQAEAWASLYQGPVARADALLVGCALAAFMAGRRDGQSRSRLAGAATVALILPLPALAAAGAAWLVLESATVAGLTAVAIWASVQRGRVAWLCARPLVLVGRRSYGLYLWHYPIFSLLLPVVPGPRPVVAVALAALAWVVALLSWRYVESPFLSANAERPVARLDGATLHDPLPARQP